MKHRDTHCFRSYWSLLHTFDASVTAPHLKDTMLVTKRQHNLSAAPSDTFVAYNTLHLGFVSNHSAVPLVSASRIARIMARLIVVEVNRMAFPGSSAKGAEIEYFLPSVLNSMLVESGTWEADVAVCALCARFMCGLHTVLWRFQSYMKVRYNFNTWSPQLASVYLRAVGTPCCNMMACLPARRIRRNA